MPFTVRWCTRSSWWCCLQFTPGYRQKLSNRSGAVFPPAIDKLELNVCSGNIAMPSRVLCGCALVVFDSCRCFRFDDGSLLLYADLRISCHSPRYKLMLTVAIVMMGVFPIGVPLYLGLTLWRHRAGLYPRNRGRILVVSQSPDGVQPTILSVKSELVPAVMRPVLHRKVRAVWV